MSSGLSFNDAILLTSDAAVSAQVSPESPNIYFALSVAEGETYSFTTLSDNDMYGHLYDSNRNEISSDDDSGEGYNPLIRFTASETTTMYVMVRGYRSSDVIDFQASLTLIVPQAGDSFGRAISLELGVPQENMLFPQFTDVYYKANLTAGKTYTFEISDIHDAHFYGVNEHRIFDYSSYWNGDYSAIDFVAITSIVYIQVFSRQWPPELSEPFDLILKEVDITTVKGVSIDSAPSPIQIGETVKLNATVRPDTATNKTVRWISHNPSVATVDSDGLVTGIQAGEARIQVLSNDYLGFGTSIYITVSRFQGGGATTNPYLIKNAEDLNNVRLNLNAHYKQTADIDLTGLEWEPIGNSTNNFTGSYDGDNYTINGLTINQTTMDNVGLFGVAECPLRNAKLTNVNVIGRHQVGGLVGSNHHSIINCHAHGNVQGKYSVGVLAGIASGDSVGKNLFAYNSSTGSVKGQSFCGGLVGSLFGSISKCWSAADVTGWGEVGGLLGIHSSPHNGPLSITDCYATGTVDTTNGGSSSSQGGIVGYITIHDFYLYKTAYIKNCYTTSDGYGRTAYGICNSGVRGVDASQEIENCFVLSKTVGVLDAYDFCPIGVPTELVNNSYVVDDIEYVQTKIMSRPPIVYKHPDAKSVSRQQAMHQSTYENNGWDFENVWEMKEGMPYPVLRAMSGKTKSKGQLSAIALDELIISTFHQSVQ